MMTIIINVSCKIESILFGLFLKKQKVFVLPTGESVL